MLDIDEQLARLKERIAQVNRRWQEPRHEAAVEAINEPEQPRISYRLEDCVNGRVVANEHGEHFVSDCFFPAYHSHGSADVGALSELPSTFLDELGDGQIRSASPLRWAFLDTETTGLAGGSGTYAFLVGVGSITPEGFRVRQYFMREYIEERSMLHALSEHLREFDVLITYNGKAYDAPLLEARYRMTRQRPPLAALDHVDLLYGARRLWKLRLEGCKLVQLEAQILGYHREDDAPGELIPYLYFDYLRSGYARRIRPIFEHNAYDILTLACLTAIVPAAFRSTDETSLARIGVRRGEELLGIARWLLSANQQERALDLFTRALKAGLPDRLLFRTIWDLACLEKKLKRHADARNRFEELAGCRNAHQIGALEELAKFEEHREKNYELALLWTEKGLELGETDSLLSRRVRLKKRLQSDGRRSAALAIVKTI